MQLLVEIRSLHKINQEKLSSFQQVSVEVLRLSDSYLLCPPISIAALLCFMMIVSAP